MTNVIVVASGETERAALPSLVSVLESEGIHLLEIRTPPNGRMSAAVVKKVVVAAYWSSETKPDVFVVLIDADGREPLTSVIALQQELDGTSRVPTRIIVTAAKWHLEAWFFADPAGLRAYLGRDLGNADPTQPDAIVNPKAHLKNLLGDAVYTARMAGDIARRLKPAQIHQNSPSFRRFSSAMRQISD